MPITLGTDGYCEATDVERLTGKDYTTTSAPTTAQVETEIKEAFPEMNGRLQAAGYTVPIPTTATAASLILKRITARKVAAAAEAQVPGIKEEPARAKVWREEAEGQLDLIGKGKMSLVDATTTDDTAVLEGAQEPAGSFDLNDDDEEKDPVFDKDMKG